MTVIALPTTNFAENAGMTVSRVSAVLWCFARNIYRKGEQRKMIENEMTVSVPLEVVKASERRKNLLKTVAKSSKQRYVLIVRQSLPLQAIDRYSVQRIVAIKQGRIKRKPTEKRKKAITIIVSVYVLCVAVPTGLHTVSRNSAPRNVKR